MNVLRLVLREISHRKANFALALLSVTVAVASFVGALTLLRAHEVTTNEILSATKAKTEKDVQEAKARVEEAGTELNEAMRKITVAMGFNLLILPQDQDPDEFRANGVITKTMPESYGEKLAKSKIVTINHIQPIVTERVKWKEANDQTIFLIGTHGEVPLAHTVNQKPIQAMIELGNIVVGHSLHQKMHLKKGDKVTLLGRSFLVSELRQKSQSQFDDVTVWVNLKDAQQMLSRQNLINGISALECNCAAKDRIGQIRADLEKYLPGVQVIEPDGSKNLAPAEARNHAQKQAAADLALAKETGETRLATERKNRADVQSQTERLASILVPLAIIGSALIIGFLAFANVRQRRGEIGILRAIGLRSTQILWVFLGKALLVGLAGAALGFLAGIAIATRWGERASTSVVDMAFGLELLLLALVMAPVLSGLASWIPAMLAAGQDPAVVLQDDH